MTNPAPLRIRLLCHSFNSLSQRLLCELRTAGHEVSVELDIADGVTEWAVAMFRPDLVIAPFLKRMIPASVWQQHVCLIVHPGPVGDRGPSALDWAVLEGQPEWGVTVLQATGDFDAGPVWAHAAFPMRGAAKGSLYRKEVTAAAVACVLRATERFVSGSLAPSALSGALQGGLPDAADSAAPQHIWRPAQRAQPPGRWGGVHSRTAAGAGRLSARRLSSPGPKRAPRRVQGFRR